jgi:hypothetical protein
MSPTLLSSIAVIFLPECMRFELHSPSPNIGSKKQIACDQYGRILYLGPVMPPMTRRQNRIMGMRGSEEEISDIDGGNE